MVRPSFRTRFCARWIRMGAASTTGTLCLPRGRWGAGEAARVSDGYFGELTTCLPVDRAVAEMAWQLRALIPQRLPLVDALIAATARAAGAILVHKDPHMSRIPTTVVKQLVLP